MISIEFEYITAPCVIITFTQFASNQTVHRERDQAELHMHSANKKCYNHHTLHFSRLYLSTLAPPPPTHPTPTPPGSRPTCLLKLAFPFGYGSCLCDASALFFFHNFKSSVSFCREVTERLGGTVWAWLDARPPSLKHFGLHTESF